MADEKLPDPTPDATKPASEKDDAAVQSGSDRPPASQAEAQEATIDQLLQDVMDDADKAALYHLLSVC